MIIKKRLTVAALIVAASAGGIAAYLLVAADGPPAGQVWATAQPIRDIAVGETVKLSGRVVGPDGKPVGGAKVAAISQYRTAFGDGVPRATTGPDGTFELPLPRSGLAVHLGAGQPLELVATADGLGMAWGPAGDFLPSGEPRGAGDKERVLRLVPDDAPLTGQVKTADGRPASGARVELAVLMTSDKDDLGSWLAAVRRGDNFGQAMGKLNRYLGGPGLAHIATTADANGRFRMKGIGRGRLATLNVWGPTAACTIVVARTEPGEAVVVNGLSSAFHGNPQGCFGADFTLSVPVSRPVVGVVTDAETDQPVADARVRSLKFARVNFMPDDALSTRTDAAGRFRLEGFPVGRDNLVMVQATEDQPYPAVQVEADTSGAGEAVPLKVRLRRGSWVEGRVADAKTGRPLLATIDVFYPRDNPNLARYPDLGGMPPGLTTWTDGAGHYRVAIIPGRAAVAARVLGQQSGPSGKSTVAQAGRSYPLLGAVKIDGLSEDPLVMYSEVLPSFLFTYAYHRIRGIDISAGVPSMKCDLLVD